MLKKERLTLIYLFFLFFFLFDYASETSMALPPHRCRDGGGGAAAADFFRIHRGSGSIFIEDC
jgi:hypothetical protein